MDFFERMIHQRNELMSMLTDYQCELDFLEWSFYIGISDDLKLNVSICEDEGYTCTTVYKVTDDCFFRHPDSCPLYHYGTPEMVATSIKETADPLIWWFNRRV